MNDEIDLPIKAHADEIVNLVRDNVVVVISGETGCGKTTQIPQFLYDSKDIHRLVKRWRRQKKSNAGGPSVRSDEENDFPKIVVVQPHRIAAIAMARRVSDERQTPLGETIGYTVRWDSLMNKEKTKIR